MVLETRLVFRFLLSASVISSSCAANSDNTTDHAKIDGHSLTLKTSGAFCVLDIDDGDTIESKTLSVKPPCYFLRRDSEEPQSYSYNDVGILSTMIVIDSQISDEKRKKWGLSEKSICGENRQGVLVKESGVVVTEKTLDGGVSCKDQGADEKDFWYFAH